MTMLKKLMRVRGLQRKQARPILKWIRRLPKKERDLYLQHINMMYRVGHVWGMLLGLTAIQASNAMLKFGKAINDICVQELEYEQESGREEKEETSSDHSL